MHLLTKENMLRCALFGLATLSGQTLMAANNVQVGNCQNRAGVATITDAVAAVAPGGTIVVCPGMYPEQVVINKPLTLKGIQDGSSDAAIIVPPAGGLVVNSTRVSQILTPGRDLAAQILVTAATGSVNISNLAVDDTGNSISDCPDVILTGIYYRHASGTIQNVATRNQIISPGSCNHRGFGILAETGGISVSPVSASVTVQDSTIRSYQTVGIAADDFGLTVTLKRNTIFGPGASTVNGIQVEGATGTVVNNAVTENGADFSTGIVADAAHAVVISGNTVSQAGTGVFVGSDDSINGDADKSTVTSNILFDVNAPTAFSGAILICSNQDTVLQNEIDSSSIAAVFVDTCGNSTFGSNNNTVKNNTINEACVGVLLNPATTGNLVFSNTYFNVVHTVQSGTSCSPALAAVRNSPAGPRGNPQ